MTGRRFRTRARIFAILANVRWSSPASIRRTVESEAPVPNRPW
jgi:hypothetical protein